jgi:hypothetical protein
MSRERPILASQIQPEAPPFSAAFKTAREFAENKLPVFPTYGVVDGRCSCGKDCESPGKHPLTPNGFKDATTEERALLRWNQRWPDANWAVACGDKFAVVDIDSKNGADAAVLLDEHDLAGAVVWTGKALEGDLLGVRGAHVYCLNGVPTGDAPVKGVDIRAAGSYVLLPGSRHISGVPYEWRDERRPWGSPLVEVPLALRPRQQPRTAAPAVEGVIPKGERNDTLTSLGGSMRRRGMGEAAIAAALLVENANRCTPPLDEGEVRGIAKSVSSYEPEAPMTNATSKQLAQQVTERLDLRSDPIADVKRWGRHEDSRLVVTLRSGRRIVFDRARDTFDPGTLKRRVVLATDGQASPGTFTKPAAEGVAVRLIRLANVVADADDRDEARGLGGSSRLTTPESSTWPTSRRRRGATRCSASSRPGRCLWCATPRPARSW